MKTKDWLLQQFAGEVARHEKTKAIYQESLAELDALQETISGTASQTKQFWDKEMELVALRERVKEMAPEKQFCVLMRPRGRAKAAIGLEITSVSSANGKTTIFVNQPPKLVWDKRERRSRAELAALHAELAATDVKK